MSRLLTVDNVSSGYGLTKVLRNVSMHVDTGEVVSVVGANGVGKSTLLKTITGLVHATDGHIVFDGVKITGMPAHSVVSHGLAMVPEGGRLFPFMTVLENLELGAFNPHTREDESQSLDEVMELFPILRERRHQLAGSLSGGERQMLAMSRALMMEPSVLLLDEPSAGLSPAMQDEVFVQTRRINRAGVSVVMVEQNARRCLQICHRGYVLDQGRNAYTASGKQLISDPKVIELYLGSLARA